jgi:hypothetical protein
MEWSVFDIDLYVNPYVDFRGVALNPAPDKPRLPFIHYWDVWWKQTRYGCRICDVAICDNQHCWDLYHHLI